MPYPRPTLSQLRAQVSADIVSALSGSGGLLRFSNMGITGEAQAAMAHGHYGYIDWIAQQATPYTATDEYLEAWAALVNIFRVAATSAAGSVMFSGTNGTILPSGTQLSRADGVAFITTSTGIVSGGLVTVTASAVDDSTGQTGAFGNTDAGVSMSLGSAIAGIQSGGTVSTAFVGGADIEKDDSLRSRMLLRYQQKPQGGAQSDYVAWALEVAGVTRAWCKPNGMGTGTVVVYVMLDSAEAAHNGFPQGNDGVATDEPRAVAATGDQLLVANHVLPLQPVTALVYTVAPTAHPINLTIQGVPVASRTAATAAIAALFVNEGSPGGTIILAHVWSAIAAVTGVNDFVIQSPTADITNPTGSLPTVGTITWM